MANDLQPPPREHFERQGLILALEFGTAQRRGESVANALEREWRAGAKSALRWAAPIVEGGIANGVVILSAGEVGNLIRKLAEEIK